MLNSGLSLSSEILKSDVTDRQSVRVWYLWAMDPASVALLITALLGSSGLASLLVGSVQLGRRARLHRTILTTASTIDALPGHDVATRALRMAAERDSLRLAAMSLITLTPRFRRGVVIVAAVFVIAAIASSVPGLLNSLFSAPASTASPTQQLALSPATPLLIAEAPAVFVVVIVVYVICVTVLIDGVLWRRREAFVTATVGSVAFSSPVDLIRRAEGRANCHASTRAEGEFGA